MKQFLILSSALSIVFAVLKITGIIMWSWWWMMSFPIATIFIQLAATISVIVIAVLVIINAISSTRNLN